MSLLSVTVNPRRTFRKEVAVDVRPESEFLFVLQRSCKKLVAWHGTQGLQRTRPERFPKFGAGVLSLDNRGHAARQHKYCAALANCVVQQPLRKRRGH